MYNHNVSSEDIFYAFQIGARASEAVGERDETEREGEGEGGEGEGEGGEAERETRERGAEENGQRHLQTLPHQRQKERENRTKLST